MKPGERVLSRVQRQDDGQWFVCEQGVSWTTHEPYVYWRPVYPDHPQPSMQRIWPEKEVGYVPPEQPQQPAIPVDVEHPSVPAAVKKAVAAARGAGWAWDLRRAVSAEGAHTLAVRASKPGRRIAMAWTWVPGHMTAPTEGLPERWIPEKRRRDGSIAPGHMAPATSPRPPRWMEPTWKNDGAWIRALGRHDLVSHTEAVKELNR